MTIEFMLNRFKVDKEQQAVIWKDKIYSYGWLLERITYWQQQLSLNKINPGNVVVIEADFSPDSVALFLALVEHNCILVPLTNSVKTKKNSFMKTAQAEISIMIDKNDLVDIKKINN
ncbi:MAG: long-chain fatty acid--CoA ligase, partial [bacterium]|nr:long-chain fatty acid--CoA ligase [bacterium]